MKFFADTAEIAEIRELAETGLLDGVTTNPSLIHKSGRDFLEVVREIASVVSGPVSAEVVALDYDGMMREAEVLRKIADNIAIKVPLTPAGLKACKALTGDGTHGQRDLVLLGRPGAARGQGRRDLHLAVRRPPRRCRVRRHAADRRHPPDLRQLRFSDARSWSPACATRCTCVEAAKIGADVMTAPPKIIWQLFKHPLTDAGIAIFP